MKALSLWQPWASLIACGAKKVETRGWKPPLALIGQRIAIHATASVPASVKKMLSAPDGPIELDFVKRMRWAFAEPNQCWAFSDLPMGAVICTARLADVFPLGGADDESRPISDQERAFGDYSAGRVGWLLDEIQAVHPPVPARGKQGLWDWLPPDLQAVADVNNEIRTDREIDALVADAAVQEELDTLDLEDQLDVLFERSCRPKAR